MKTSFWYHVDEKLPKKSGTYVTFVGPTIASDDSGVGTSYFRSNRGSWNAVWQESCAPQSAWANVVYWCDAEPAEWYENTNVITHTPALDDAWAAVQDAVSKYEMLRALTTETC
jgi:hypothetical protein